MPLKKEFHFILLLLSTALTAQNALHFDGVDDYIQTNYKGIEGAAPRTIEAWIKVKPSDSWRFIVDQMYHALLLLFVGSTKLIQQKTKQRAFYLVLFGVLFFSGSIYGLATNDLTGYDFKTIGFITPIGGLCLIASWGLVLKDFLKLQTDK